MKGRLFIGKKQKKERGEGDMPRGEGWGAKKRIKKGCSKNFLSEKEW